MTELDSTEPLPAQATLERLQQTQSQSAWLIWASITLALVFWIGAAFGAVAVFGWEQIESAPPEAMIAGGLAALLPGLMVIMAGIFGREQQKSAAANALVLEAAARLTSPAQTTSSEATAFAEQMKQACADIDRAMGHALSAMQAMASEIGDERQRLESVTYASADNARDLSERLATERTALESLARELSEQSSALNSAIPRQAGMMIESAQTASQEVARAESSLHDRLSSLQTTGQALTQTVGTLDQLAAEANQRNETLLFAIARMEEKLEQSSKMVDTASRAGELAAAAASTTGDRLLEAVKTALDGARDASAEIQRNTLQASEAAAAAMAGLKSAGQETAAALQAAGDAGRNEVDFAPRETRRPVAQQSAKPVLSQAPPVAAPPPIAEAPLPVEREIEQEPNSAPELFGGPPAVPEPKSPASSPPPAARVSSPSQTTDDDLFETQADKIASVLTDDGDPFGLYGDKSSQANGKKPEPMQDQRPNGKILDAEFSERPGETNGNTSLSDIIEDMERADHTALPREETAKNLVVRLEQSGIPLADVFRPKDKKKVAQAARKGEKQRRDAISNSAGKQVDRVRKRLRGDGELLMLARHFIAHETTDALNALENTQATQKNASARLATFLLVDTALG
ncbi:MAG: Yip1 family protein [Pseudomonadota bacterium]